VTAPALRSLSGLGRIWFELGATEQYYPVLHSAFWVEHKLWGDATTGYHLANVLLHATSECLLAAILQRLAIRGA
jgi:protein O-mannosyl-transferase